MTQAEAQVQSNLKVQKIKDLAKELQVVITAEQAIVSGNRIKNVVFFMDQEEYKIDPVAPTVEKKPEVGAMTATEETPHA